jgi:hypothetical protein
VELCKNYRKYEFFWVCEDTLNRALKYLWNLKNIICEHEQNLCRKGLMLKYLKAKLLYTNLLPRNMILDVVREYFSVGLQVVYLKSHFKVTVQPIKSQ